jgi:putative acetyltransferase
MKNDNILIKNYEEKDAIHLVYIYFNTIHKINAKDYSPDQVNAWAPITSLETGAWIKKWQKTPPIVAMIKEEIVGFAEFEDNGHIDCFYCHHEFQGVGVGTVLINAIENKARKNNIPKIFAEVSLTAKPFFEAKGFNIVKKQIVNLRGVALTNFVMEKILI